MRPTFFARCPCLAGLFLLVGLFGTPAARAQEAAVPPADSLRTAQPFVRLFGTVRMETLRFRDAIPEVRVRFFGDLTDTLRYTSDNLPRPLRTDTTYRDVRVYFELSAAFDDLDRLLREALGDAPADTLRRPRP